MYDDLNLDDLGEQFTTKDLQLATILKTAGIDLSDVNRVNPKEVWFVFKNKSKCKETIMDYYNGNITVNAKELFDNHKQLKGLLNI